MKSFENNVVNSKRTLPNKVLAVYNKTNTKILRIEHLISLVK